MIVEGKFTPNRIFVVLHVSHYELERINLEDTSKHSLKICWIEKYISRNHVRSQLEKPDYLQ